ncbi:MAG: hypothetical protein MUO94_03430 [Thermoplasmata archaeon]|nr:hypothetical protein [Thermoplasmata archaeon]
MATARIPPTTEVGLNVFYRYTPHFYTVSGTVLRSDGTLVPGGVDLTLTSSEAGAAEENRELLEGVGFAVEPFGENDYALRAIPTVLGVAQGELALRNILAELAESSSPRRLGLDVIWRVSCHTAIRAGQSLSHAEMRRLISDLMATDNPYTCEHGRPTMVVLSSADLEKLFKRRV